MKPDRTLQRPRFDDFNAAIVVADCAGDCPNTAVSNEWIFKAMIRIGNLTVFPGRREIFVDGSPVELGCRAMDVLLVLIEANGALVTKEKLLGQVWPTTVVVDNNLHVHICGIRKIMGEDRKLLVSVRGRGYRLLRPVQRAHAASIFVGGLTRGRAHSSLFSSSAQRLTTTPSANTIEQVQQRVPVDRFSEEA